MIEPSPLSKRWDVLGLGAVTVDDLFFVEQHPPPNTKMAVSGKARSGGGPTATALVATARLGATAAFAAVLGDDDLSRFSIQALEEMGVDCGPVVIRPGAQPYHAIVIVERPTGQRSILFSDRGVIELQPEEVSEELVAACRVLLIDHSAVDAVLQAIEIAHAHGIPVVADCDRLTHPRALEALRQVDHLIVGMEFGE